MLQPHPSRAAETRHPAFPATRSSRSGGLNHYVCPKRKMLAKSWHKTDSDDTGILHKARNRGREAASGALGAVTVLDPSARIACAEHADCLCEACRLLVRSAQKPCYGLPEGQPALQKWLSEASKRVFFIFGSCFSRYFRCKDFAIYISCSRLRVFVSVFPRRPDRKPKKRILAHQKSQSVKM